MFGVKYKCACLKSTFGVVSFCTNAFIIVSMIAATAAVLEIRNILVPDDANLLDPDPVMLECWVGPNILKTEDVVVKWFLDKTMLYQWVKEKKAPYINTTLIDAGSAKLTQITKDDLLYAPLLITNKTKKHSGTYKCTASADIEEPFEERFLQFYVPPVHNITLEQEYDNTTNELSITCATENVYPKPSVLLTINGQNETAKSVDVHGEGDQLFNIYASYALPVDNLSSVVNKINCAIILPQVDRNFSRSTIFVKSGFENTEIPRNDVSTSAQNVNETDAPDSLGATGSSSLNRINSFSSIVILGSLILRDFI